MCDILSRLSKRLVVKKLIALSPEEFDPDKAT